jgi:hypothetical protein
MADGAKGSLSVATLLPFAVSAPVAKFTLKAETELSPCVVTKRAPVPVVDGLVVEQLSKLKTATTSKPAKEANFIPILSPWCFFER